MISLIRSKFPNLECFAFSALSSASFQSYYGLFEHNSLKQLNAGDNVIHTILRTLSNNGVIEEFSFIAGIFDSKNIETYTFNELKSLKWRDGPNYEYFNDFIKTFTRANMPKLQNFFF